LALKIVLVDDQPVPGLTLRRWLRKQRNLEVVGEAVPGPPVLALIQLVEPDAVLLDLLTSPEAGLDVAKMIREQYPNVPIVAIGEATAGSLRVEAAEAGAWAFFPKSRPEDLAKAIPSVIEGKGRRFFDLTERTFQRPPSDSFVAHHDEKPRRGAPEPPPVTVEAAPTPPPKAAPLAPEPAPAAAPAPAPAAAPKPIPVAASISAAPAAAPKARTAVAQVSPAAVKKAPTTAPPRTPAKAVPPSPAPEKPRRARPSPAAKAPESTFELRPDPPARTSRDALAWTHSALEPVFDSPLQKKPRRRRAKKDDAPAEIDVRGPTGLPRRFGGHR
jgi:DNA-binding NarL/FixJ family response regulator